MKTEQIIKENARRNAEKKKDYNPLSGLNCCGERFELKVSDKAPGLFYFPVSMQKIPEIQLLSKHESVEALLKATFKRKPTIHETEYFWLQVCELRYKYDFEFFAIMCETIIDKVSGEKIKFKLNRAQRRLLSIIIQRIEEGRQINVQILKAKQMGFSTLVEMIFKWIQTIQKKNWNSFIIAQDKTAASNIRAMYGDSVKEMIPIGGEKMELKNFESTQNIKLITQTGSRITVSSAETPNATRSQNAKLVHFSEMAFYPNTENNNPSIIETSAISSLTDGPFTAIIRESTANGEGDYFHKQWLIAKSGKSAYYPFFAPWFEILLYEIPFDGKYYIHQSEQSDKNGNRQKKGTVSEFIETLTEYEWNLWNNNTDCTLENLNWRRMKAATMPSEWQMKQDYPSDDVEAFQSVGNPVFNIDNIEALRPDCCLPDAVGTLHSKCSPHLSIVEAHRRSEILENIMFVPDKTVTDAVYNADPSKRIKRGENKIWVWEYPDKEKNISDRYLVTFDPQKGTSDSADYGVIKVIDRYWMMHGGKPEVVAMFYGHIAKDITIWIATQIAKWYNDALLVIEKNTYDSDIKEDDTPFIFEIIKEHYNNLYSDTDPQKIQEGKPLQWGIHTNSSTKPMYIETGKSVFREKAYIERDEETINEYRTFEEKPNHKTGAKAGCHDDRVMATLIGLYICFNKMPLPQEIKQVSHQKYRPMAW